MRTTNNRRVAIYACFALLLLLSIALLSRYPQHRQVSLNNELQSTSIKGSASQILQLVESGANVNDVDSQGGTPLMHAANSGNEEAIKALVEHGADVQKKGVGGVTPLYLAAQYGYPAIVKILLSKGANANTTTDRGKTALDVAESARRIKSRSSNKVRHPLVADFDEVIQLLQRAGAKPGR